MKTKTRLGKVARRLAVAAVGTCGIFSAGCDPEECYNAMYAMGTGDKSALVSKVNNRDYNINLSTVMRYSGEPPIWRWGNYQLRKPGIDSRGPHINVDKIKPYIPYHIRPLDVFRWPLWYIRTPFTDSLIIQQQQQEGLTQGQIRI